MTYIVDNLQLFDTEPWSCKAQNKAGKNHDSWHLIITIPSVLLEESLLNIIGT